MRFLREMIVRKSAAGVPGEAADEPPVKDFFELPPMRDRLARSRGPEAGTDAGPAMDDDDGDDVASSVAGRLGSMRHVPVEKPRADLKRGPQGGFEDEEFGTFDPEELDALDLDDPEEAAPVAAPVVPRSPHLARRPMTAPRDEVAAQRMAAWDDEEAEAAQPVADLTDDPALQSLVAGRRAAAARPEAVDPHGTVDDTAILASIAAALPPAARATLPPSAPRAEVAAPVPPTPPAAPVVAPPAPPVAAAAAPAAPAPVSPRAPRIWDLEPEAQETAVMRFAETAVPPPMPAPQVAQAAAAPYAAPQGMAAPMPVPPVPPQVHAPQMPTPQAPVMQAPMMPAPAMQAPAMPQPAAQPDPARRQGRVRTRLLGFHAAEDLAPDPMAGGAVARPAGPAQFPVGWVVVIDGPGRGAAFTLGAGVSSIGRDDSQAIQLDFGDTAISRQMHAAIAYDPETRGFFLGHGGKSNIVRLNGRPVLSTEDLKDGDVIRIGETTLKLVAFCGRNFDWADGARDADDARA